MYTDWRTSNGDGEAGQQGSFAEFAKLRAEQRIDPARDRVVAAPFDFHAPDGEVTVIRSATGDSDALWQVASAGTGLSEWAGGRGWRVDANGRLARA